MNKTNHKKDHPYSIIDKLEISLYFSIASLLVFLSIVFYIKTNNYKNSLRNPLTTTETSSKITHIKENTLYHNISFIKNTSRNYYPGGESKTYTPKYKTKKLLNKQNNTNTNLKYKNKPKKNKPKKYTIQTGDTLTQIASNFNVSFVDIALLNNIENPNLIPKGKTIDIPNYFYL